MYYMWKHIQRRQRLTLHVVDVHKDYYFDEDNSLLLKENMVFKENTVSKCKLCLENFKVEDLQQHLKGLHPEEPNSNAVDGGNEQDDQMEDDSEKDQDVETEPEDESSIEPEIEEEKSEDRKISDKENGNEKQDIAMKGEDSMKESYDEFPNLKQENIVIDDHDSVNGNSDENDSFIKQI